jgi:hypothetical protein
MECKFIEKCPFFNGKMKTKQSLLKMYKKNYCLEDNSKCARYIIAIKLGKEYVPSNLYPNMYDKAMKLLSEKQINDTKLQ